MKKNEPIRSIMTANPHTAHTGQKPSEVRQLFVDRGFHHLPVTRGGKLVGILSSSDILRLVPGAWGGDDRQVDAMLDSQFTVETMMNAEVRSMSVHGTVRDAVDILSEVDFHALPVIDDEGLLTGIVTSTDLIRYLRDQY